MALSLPQGFRYGGLAAGIKKSGKDDLAIILADSPCQAVGVYTQNRIHAASIDWNRSLTPGNQLRGIVINSGNANACTGDRGVADNRRLAQLAAEATQTQTQQWLTLSTGIIGEFLPMERIAQAMPAVAQSLGSEVESFQAATQAIMTTDQYPKFGSRTLSLAGNQITIAAMAKGAGMIGPNMATMLGLITTDADIPLQRLDEMLKRVADRSFNCISVEGHTSTNDALVLLSNGKVPVAAEDEAKFEETLLELCCEVAKMIPADGEGASHLITIDVQGASCREDALTIAKSVASSALVKTAVTGSDPNWGRIVSAAGYAGIAFEPDQTSLAINGIEIFAAGQPTDFEPAQVSQSMAAQKEVFISLAIGSGKGHVRFWTSDLTVNYVTFNSDYHT